MIGPIQEYISWVTAPDNGYLMEGHSERWDQFAQRLPGGSDGQQNLRAALGPHLPEPIPDALHEDPELDLGGYWLGLENAWVDVIQFLDKSVRDRSHACSVGARAGVYITPR
jgi:hypothetical protein